MNQQVPARITKADLVEKGMDALDPDRVGAVPVSSTAGGITFSTALEVMEFAKLLCTAGQAIPAPFRNNPGLCLAATFQAVEWHMSPLAVINKMYVVNDRIGYESQLVHAVIEARAPLRERLDFQFEGEGPDRVCKAIFRFMDGTERVYTSPKFKDITPKNSPLWKADPDQQHTYFSARAGSRRFCPDVIMGVYTREELAHDRNLGRPEEPDAATTTGIIDRLAANGVDRTEGHRPGHVESELSQVAAENTGPIIEASTDDAPKPQQASQPAHQPGRVKAGPQNRKRPKPGKPPTKAQAKAVADRAAARSKATQPAGKPAQAPGKGAAAPAATVEPGFDDDTPIAKVETPTQYLKWWERRVEAAKAKKEAATDVFEIYAGQDELRTKLAVPVSLRLKITDQLIPSINE